MRQYTGTKTILARPMTRGEYLEYQGLTEGTDTLPPNADGYLVEYVDGGAPNHPNHKTYISWSPKEVFERAYHPSETHVERMLIEYTQLATRINALLAFTRTDTFRDLPDSERDLLNEQFAAMSRYEVVLSKRIESARQAEGKTGGDEDGE